MSRRPIPWELPLAVATTFVVLCLLSSLLWEWLPVPAHGALHVAALLPVGHHSMALPSILGVPSAVAIGSVLATLALAVLLRQMLRTRRALAPLLSVEPLDLYPGLQRLLREEGMESTVDLVRAESPLVFCYGYARPRVLISTGLMSLLSPAQLRAVLLHEEWHRRRRDPLRLLLIDSLSAAFFFLPAVYVGRRRLRLQLELEADRYAVERQGKAPLAGALHRLLTRPLCATVSPFVGISASAVRIAVLLDEPVEVPGLSPQRAFLSLAQLVLLCHLFL